MIKADLKHWGAERPANGPYKIDYERFARQARDKLGDKCLVGIPNARGPDNPLGAEYRFEELYGLAKKSSSITSLKDGRAFHDDRYNIWFVKSQEVNSKHHGKKITYLVFNVPFGKNFNEKNNEALYNQNIINVLTLPSCIEQINEGMLSIDFLSYFSGIVIHSSSATILKGINPRAEEFYNNFVKGNSFYNHKIGALSVSGGHRSPNLIQKIICPISVGSSYTLFPEFEGKTLDDFNDWLKNSIENSQDINELVKGSSMRETVLGHILKFY